MIDEWGLMWAGVGMASAGWYGYLRGRRRSKMPKEPEPVCGCGHHYSVHDESGACRAGGSSQVLVERGSPRTVRTGYNGERHKTVYDHEKWETKTWRCACVRYTGPEPLPRYIS